MSNQITSGGKPINPRNLWDYFGTTKPSVKNPLPITLQEITGRYRVVNVSSLGSRINRDTEVKHLKKITKNGIDGDNWYPPRVVYIRSIRKLYLYDGDHSLHLWKQMHPDATEIVVEYREVDAIEEYHKLFVHYNLEGRTSISAETGFVHRYYARETKQVDLAACMSVAGVYVYGSNESGGRVGDPLGCKIKVNAAKKCALYASGRKSGDPTSADVQNSKAFFAPAVGVYDSLKCFVSSKATLKSELVGALVQLMRAYPSILASAGPQGDFRLWFHNKFAHSEINHEVSKWKTSGGNIHNKAEYSIAKGIVLDLQGNPNFSGITAAKLDKLFA